MQGTPGDARSDALQALVSTRHALLLGVALKIVRDRDLAEDVVQETLARVWQRLGEVEPGKVEAYVVRAVQINALKTRARRRQVLSLDENPELAPAGGWDEDDDPQEIDPLLLEDALDGLPEGQKAVIRLKYYVGLSFREIGEALSISGNTAASRCRYALETLRKALKRKGEEEK